MAQMAHLRLNEKFLHHYPDAKRVLVNVPGCGDVTLTRAEPVLARDGRCVAVPVDYVRAAKLHLEEFVARGNDGEHLRSGKTYDISRTPFAVPMPKKVEEEPVFNADGDDDSVFNAAPESADVEPEPATDPSTDDEAPEAQPEAKPAPKGPKGRFGKAPRMPDPGDLP